MKVKLFLLLAALCMLGQLTFAQTAKNSSTFSISGTVADSVTKNKLPGVTITLLSRESGKVIKGVISDDKGSFRIDDAALQEFRIRFTIIGYGTKIIDSLHAEKSKELKLGTVLLPPSSILLSEVEIKGQRPMIEYRMDKQVINMDKVPGASGSVTDALKNTGLVDVDPQSKKISIRGSQGVNILIDGRPMPMGADLITQMPASMIDQVEISTHGTAKDDAEGDAATINLVTKKGNSDNYNGSVSLNTSTQGMTFGSAMFNFKKSTLNFSSSLMGGLGAMDFENSTMRTSSSTQVHQQNSNGVNSFSGFMTGIKLGVDYDPDPINSFSVTGSYYRVKMDNDFNTENYNYNIENLFTYSYSNKSANKGTYDNYAFTAYYKNKINDKGCEISSDVFYSILDNVNNSDLNSAYNYAMLTPKLQKTNNTVDNNTVIFKIDYVNPSASIGKFDAGYRFTFRDRGNDYVNLNYMYGYSGWGDSLSLGNYFKYKESIHAVYANYSNKIWILDYRLGARLEQTFAHGDQVTSNSSFDMDYLSFFPNFTLSYNFSPMMQITFNTARKITRPQMDMINPFTRISGPNSISRGNPKLDPTYVYLYEFGLMPVLKFYYTSSTGRPQNISSLENDSIMVSSTVNTMSTKTYGVELNLPIINSPQYPVKLPSWLGMINISATYFRMEDKAGYLSENYAFTRDVWRISANSSLNLLWDVNAMIYCRYTPKSKDSRNAYNGSVSLGLSLTKEFLEKKLRVSISGNDLLDSSERISETWANSYYMYSRGFVKNSRSVALSITWMFNDFKNKRERQIDDGRDKSEGGLF
ncbi:MAG: outer membrane beta-barrel protein [Ignavibacteriales bacterium]